MEKTITIKFSTGKEIQLTESEYEELKQEFAQIRKVDIPYYPSYPPCFPYIPSDTGTPWVLRDTIC